MSTLRKMLRHHRIAAVAYGFRSSLRDWAAEETDHPREVFEAALAHVVPNKVEAAYAWSDLFERRCRSWPTGRRISAVSEDRSRCAGNGSPCLAERSRVATIEWSVRWIDKRRAKLAAF